MVSQKSVSFGQEFTLASINLTEKHYFIGKFRAQKGRCSSCWFWIYSFLEFWLPVEIPRKRKKERKKRLMPESLDKTVGHFWSAAGIFNFPPGNFNRPPHQRISAVEWFCWSSAIRTRFKNDMRSATGAHAYGSITKRCQNTKLTKMLQSSPNPESTTVGK